MLTEPMTILKSMINILRLYVKMVRCWAPGCLQIWKIQSHQNMDEDQVSPSDAHSIWPRAYEFMFGTVPENAT